MVFSFRLITNNRKYSSRYGSILIRCSSTEYFRYTSPAVSNVYYIYYKRRKCVLFFHTKCIIILQSNRMNILLNNIDKVNKDQFVSRVQQISIKLPIDLRNSCRVMF